MKNELKFWLKIDKNFKINNDNYDNIVSRYIDLLDMIEESLIRNNIEMVETGYICIYFTSILLFSHPKTSHYILFFFLTFSSNPSFIIFLHIRRNYPKIQISYRYVFQFFVYIYIIFIKKYKTAVNVHICTNLHVLIQ